MLSTLFRGLIYLFPPVSPSCSSAAAWWEWEGGINQARKRRIWKAPIYKDKSSIYRSMNRVDDFFFHFPTRCWWKPLKLIEAGRLRERNLVVEFSRIHNLIRSFPIRALSWNLMLKLELCAWFNGRVRYSREDACLEKSHYYAEIKTFTANLIISLNIQAP